jgi:hypothetical protein
VRFEKDPEAILSSADPRSRLLMAREVDLPTPTLIGVPTDERGYQRLLRGYASRVIRATLDELIADDCCVQKRDKQIAGAWVPVGPGTFLTSARVPPSVFAGG